MDDAYGRDIAAVEAIETRGTAYLVLSLVRDGELEADDARETLEAMLDAGGHCRQPLVESALEAGRVSSWRSRESDPRQAWLTSYLKQSVYSVWGVSETGFLTVGSDWYAPLNGTMFGTKSYSIPT